MRKHYEEHDCAKDGDPGCAIAQENYVKQLVALAEEKGYHPQSFPGVRQWMRAHGQEPIPMEEAWAAGK